MKKVNVNYEKLYYGFPVILVSYYDTDGTPNVTTCLQPAPYIGDGDSRGFRNMK